MSPTSLDALELERYVGACLFTNYRNKNKCYNNNNNNNGFVNYQQHHHHHHHQFDQWAGGAPLISFANHHHRGSQNFGDDFTRNQHLTHLAKGAPLIVGNNKSYQHHRKSKPSKNNNNNNNNNNVVQQTKVFENSTNKKQIEFKNNVDNVSVISDESSGSQNSETCLPRIIRPRKRRKKDRKASSSSSNSTVCSNSISNNFLTNSSVDDGEYATLPSFFQYFEPLFQPALLEDLNESPKLHHSFEEVEESQDVNGNQPASTCQCRYCNPEGQIWDIERNSLLTNNTSNFDFSNLLPVMASPQHDIYNNLHEELLKLSLTTNNNNNNKPAFSRSTSSSSSSSSFSSSAGDLEVSTEIVTSPNGHRDIEIKFWLSGSDNKECK